MFKKLLLVALVVAAVSAETYFQETFDDKWEDRWVYSDWKKSAGEQGKWELTHGEWYGDEEKDLGLRTTQDAKFYAVSSEFGTEFSNAGKDLVIQFSVKHAQKIDCGGGYVKVFPAGLDQSKMSGDSEYAIMFGPDICGTSTKKVHVIFQYKGENHLIKENIPCESDQLTHVYTLIVHPDQTYEVRIDGTKKRGGSLLEHWDFLPAAKINDPDVSKPEDWNDEKMIDDPEDVKPEDWDDEPKLIPDPDAEKPDDWSDEDDGEWDAPMIDNPEYKGVWAPKRIENPDYSGVWEHPQIDNPEYELDEEIYSYNSLKYIGLDLWQVKSGSIFDNIIITDSIEEAEAFMDETWGETHDAEKDMFDEIEAKRKAEEEEERKRMEAEMAENEEEDEDWDEEDDMHDEL